MSITGVKGLALYAAAFAVMTAVVNFQVQLVDGRLPAAIVFAGDSLLSWSMLFTARGLTGRGDRHFSRLGLVLVTPGIGMGFLSDCVALPLSSQAAVAWGGVAIVFAGCMVVALLPMWR